jgi:hypothetical protein
MPIELWLLIWQKQHLKQMILTWHITNLARDDIWWIVKRRLKRGCFLDAWLPNSHKDYWADYGENLVVIGEAFSDATTGCPYLCYDQLYRRVERQ